MSGLHFRLHWTYEEATQCDKRVILRVRRQSLHRYSIIRRSQRSCGKRRKQRGWTFQPPHRHWSGWEEGSEERVGGVDQGVCKEDVSWRLEGLSFRIQRELNWFFPPPLVSSSLLCCLFTCRLLRSRTWRHVSLQSCGLICFSTHLCVAGLLNRRGRTYWTTRPLAGVKVHHGQWPKGPPVHCAVSQPVFADHLLM